MNRAELEQRFAGHLTVPLHVACPLWDLGPALARIEAKKHGEVLGCRVLRAGRVWRVPVADLLALAGPDMSEAGPVSPAVATTQREPTEAPDALRVPSADDVAQDGRHGSSSSG